MFIKNFFTAHQITKFEHTKMQQSNGTRDVRTILSAAIYWIILGEFVFSFLVSSNPLSLSVVADRIIDALSVSMVFLVNRVASKPPDEHYSYGFHRVETLLNVSVIVLFAIIAVISLFSSTLLMLSHAKVTSYSTFMASVISLPLILAATILMKHDQTSNFYVLFLHSFQDLIIVLMVLILSIFSIYFGLYYLEYFGNYVIVGIIIFGNRNVFKTNLRRLMEGSSINIKEVEKTIKDEFPGAHHLHVWDICEHERVATLHMRFAETTQIGEIDSIRERAKKRLREFGITHVTIQIESKHTKDN